MLFWLTIAFGLAVAYLLGSTPTAYLVGKMLRRVDIREHGSKSVGATNALRVLGPGPGLLVLLIDVAKGVLALIFVRWVCAPPGSGAVSFPSAADPPAWSAWVAALAGAAVVLGHSRSIWLRFSGGKSVATGLGVLVVMAWPVALGGLAIFGLAVALTRIISLGSILAALAAIILVCAFDQPPAYRLFVIAAALYVIARHRANIERMINGTEPRLGDPSPTRQSAHRT